MRVSLQELVVAVGEELFQFWELQLDEESKNKNR
jgi:hypothetical protein